MPPMGTRSSGELARRLDVDQRHPLELIANIPPTYRENPASQLTG
jgi:hypothetical protein